METISRARAVELPYLAVQIYVERDILSEVIRRAITEDVLGPQATSFVDQAKTGATVHFEIPVPLVPVTDEAVRVTEVMVVAQEVDDVVEEAAAFADVAQPSKQLVPEVQGVEELPGRSPFLKVRPLAFFNPSI
ncbi:hypothetical protein Nepgr_023863 [Nepenthes gracilis]|uniref:Uncharacterized protein n=1 Tax=Nepenthes gracilis TaxID=150966 RepID=A0AAD3XZH9_NEPGR|nr:hypothetical protein Nepgr_023863 [Nepenthes gracilis]